MQLKLRNTNIHWYANANIRLVLHEGVFGPLSAAFHRFPRHERIIVSLSQTSYTEADKFF